MNVKQSMRIVNEEVRTRCNRRRCFVCFRVRFRWLHTVLTPCRVGWCTQVFGPVMTIIRVSNDEECIRLVNSTSYGLGSRCVAH